VETIDLSISHPLRSFRLELALEVGRETVALVGPSGAGKTTALRAVAGLLDPERGRIAVNGEVWLDTARGIQLPPENRSVGFVFQDYALFPHMSVRRNVMYGARGDVERLLEQLGLVGVAHERPDRISGGERQRVAVARALAREPKVLLLDEPLSALDAHTRARVRAELRGLLDELALPAVLVTHDFQDAAALAPRIGVLVEGKIVQLGSAAELISSPRSSFVAAFTGGNLLHGQARPSGNGLTEITLEDGAHILSTDELVGTVGVVVYPWDIALARKAPDDSMQNHLRAAIAGIVPVGNRMRVRVGPLTAEVTAASAERLALREGQTVVASFKASGTRLVPLA
jgi:molybdenum ABC transporter ATP-binding protein